MTKKLALGIICIVLFINSGVMKAQIISKIVVSIDTMSISLHDGSSLMLESFYYCDTLDDRCETYGYIYPILISQNIYFTVNDTIVEKKVLDCLPTHKHKYKTEEITIQTLPIFEIGVYNGANRSFYYLEGACFCNGVKCPEYFGIYEMDGTLLYEGICAMHYEYCNGYKSLNEFCVREKVDINNPVHQRSNYKMFLHED